MDNVKKRGEQLVNELKEAFADVPLVFDVRGKGLVSNLSYEAMRL